MSDALGYAFAGVAVLSFGSNFVVVKKYKTGDGLFFSWVLATGIFIFGICTFLVQCRVTCTSDPISCTSNSDQTCPVFQPLAMLGGALWATGNMLTVPIIKTIGLSLGMLTWGGVNMLTGWASARFGILGVETNAVAKPLLNDIGVAIACVALGVFAFVKPTVGNKKGKARVAAGGGLLEDEHDSAYAGLYSHSELGYGLKGGGGINSDLLVDEAEEGAGEGEGGEEASWTDKLSPGMKLVFGFGMAIVSGLLYGVNFNPPQYVADHADPTQPGYIAGATSDLKAYIFSHFVGIWLTTTVYFLAYCAFTRNQPKVFPEVCFPGVISGMMWATAQVSWFFANSMLGQVVAFPIISIGPGLISALWGMFVFREITGTKNYILVAAAFVLISTATVLMALSH